MANEEIIETDVIENDEPEQQEQQSPTQQDDPIEKLWRVTKEKGLYSKSLQEFKAKYSNPESIDVLYNVVSGGNPELNSEKLYTKSKDEFYNQYFSTLKKKDGTQLSAQALQSGGSVSSPTQSQSNEEVNPISPEINVDGEDDITSVLNADQLSKSTKIQRNTGMSAANDAALPTPDEDKIAQSVVLKDKIKKRGLDDFQQKRIVDEWADMPKGVEKLSIQREDGTIEYPYSKQSLSKLRKENYLAYLGKTNALKTYVNIKNELDTEKANEFARLQYNKPTGDYYIDAQNFEGGKLNQQNLIINSLSGDKQDKALKRLDENREIWVAQNFDADRAKDYINKKLLENEAILPNNNQKVYAEDSKYNGNINDYNPDVIKKYIDPHNKTEQLIFQKYKTGYDLNNVISNSKDFNEAAIKFAAKQSPVIQEQIDRLGEINLPENMKGELVSAFLDNPDVIELSKKDPKVFAEYTKAKNSLAANYPDFNKKRISTLISQERENKGLNNWFANVPGQESTDAIVEELFKKGELSELDKNVYETKIKPEIGVWQSIKRGAARVPFGAFVDESPIHTPGFLENTQNSFNRTVHGIARSLEDVHSVVHSTPKSIKDKEDDNRLYSILQENSNVIPFVPKGKLHEVSEGTGNLAGFIIPMMAGSGIFNGVKGGELINNALMFEGANRDKALTEFPNDPTKRFLYTSLATGIDLSVAHLIPIDKIDKGLSKAFKTEIKGVVNDLASGSITQAAAKESLLEKGIKFLPKLLKENAKTSAVMTSFGVFHNTLDSLFGVNNMSASDIAYDAVKQYKSTFLTTPLLATLSAYGKNNKVNGKVLWEIGGNEETYRKILDEKLKLNPESTEIKEQIQNLDNLVSVRNDLEKVRIPEERKHKYLISSLNESIWKKKASEVKDDLIKQKYLDKAEKFRIEKEAIYKGEDKAEEFKDYDAEFDDVPTTMPDRHSKKTEDITPITKEADGANTEISKLLERKTEIENILSWDASEAERTGQGSSLKGDGNLSGREVYSKELNDINKKIKELSPSKNIEVKLAGKIELTDEQGIPIGDNVPEPTGETPTQNIVNSNVDYEKINKELIKKRGDALNKRNVLKEGTPEYNLAQKEVEIADKELNDFQANNRDLILEHGTPHDFDKFQLDKIGTGEGHQAFGHGLYFTENSKIAKNYAEKLSKDKDGLVYQVKIKDGRNKDWLEWRDALDDSQAEKISNVVKDKKSEYDKYLSETDKDENHTGSAEQLFNENISVDERPLQAGAIYLDLKDAFGSQEATRIMQEARIDGVKYKTKGGRGQEFNYVVFNPESIIIENKKSISNEKTKSIEVPKQAESEGVVNEQTGKVEQPTEEAKLKIESEHVEPEMKDGVYVDPKRTILSHRGLQEVATEFGLEDVVPRDRVTDKQLQKEAEITTSDWIKNGNYDKNIEELLIKGNRGEPVSAEQRLILQQYLANVREKTAKVKAEFGINSKEYDAQLAELSKLKETSQRIRSSTGAALRIPDIASIPDNTLEGWMNERKESASVDTLTEKQKEEVQKQHEDFEQKTKDANEKLSKANEEISKLKAELELANVKDRKYIVRKKSRENLQKERVEIIGSIKEKLKKSRGETTATILPYANELFAIAPDVKRLVRNLVDTGTSKLADVIDKVFDVLKDSMPDINKKDVRDIIAGEYNEKLPPKKELERQLEELRIEAELINKLEALQSGEQPKNEKNKIERNQQIKDLQQKIKNFKKENPDKSAQLEIIKKRNESETKKIEEKIKNKQFETEKKIPIDENVLLKKANPKLYKETMDAIIAKNEAKNKLDLAKRQDELSKRSFGRKTLDFGSKLISTSKAIKAGIDDSITFIQLGMAVMANPKAGVKAKWEALQDAASNKRFKRELAALHNSTYWNVIEKSGLDITEPKSANKEKLEETFSGNLLDTNFKIKGKRFNAWTHTGGIFERLFTSMGNNMRLNMFTKRMEMLQNEGKTFDSHPQEYKDAARVINELTGRGKMNTNIASANPIITPIIWAPRMLSSSFNLLGISDLVSAPMSKEMRQKVGTQGLYRTLTPSQRKYAFSQMGKGIGMGIAVGAAFAMNGWDFDADPRSVTFGQISNGQKSYNVFGRYANLTKTIVQLITGQKKTPEGEQDLDKRGRGGALRAFFRGKETPFAGLVTDYWLNSQKNFYTQKPITLESLPAELIEPISISEMKKALDQDGTLGLLTRWLPAFEGIQVSDVRDREKPSSFTKEELENKDLKYLSDKGVKLPEFDPKKIGIKEKQSDGTGKIKKLSDFDEETQNKYIEKSKEYFKKNLEKRMSKGYVYTDIYDNISLNNDDNFSKKKIQIDKLTKEQLSKMKGFILSDATEKVKAELFPKEYKK